MMSEADYDAFWAAIEKSDLADVRFSYIRLCSGVWGVVGRYPGGVGQPCAHIRSIRGDTWRNR